MTSSGKGSSVTKDTLHHDTRKRITFFTNSEYGQANVILAVVYELLLLQSYDINVASYGALENRIQAINQQMPKNLSPARFYRIAGSSFQEAVTAKKILVGSDRPGIKGALKTYRVTLPAIAALWSEDEYVEGMQSCIEILRATSPDVIVVDPIMSQALDACKLLSRNCVILSPNTVQEICRKQQPISTQLLKWPA